MRTMLHQINSRAMLVGVECNRNPIPENGEQRANGDRNGAHRPYVNPNRNAKSRCGCGCNRSPETRNHPNGEQKSGRTDWETLHPGRQSVKITIQVEHVRGSAVDPVSQKRRKHEPDCVDDRPIYRTEDRPVHDRERIGNRKRGRCDDRKDDDGERVGKGTDRADHVLDGRLIVNHKRRQRKRPK